MRRPQLSFFCPQKHAQAHVTRALRGAARPGLAGGAGGRRGRQRQRRGLTLRWEPSPHVFLLTRGSGSGSRAPEGARSLWAAPAAAGSQPRRLLPPNDADGQPPEPLRGPPDAERGSSQHSPPTWLPQPCRRWVAVRVLPSTAEILGQMDGTVLQVEVATRGYSALPKPTGATL